MSEEQFTTNIVEAVYNHPGSEDGFLMFPGCSNCGGWFSLQKGKLFTWCCDRPTSPTLEALQAFAEGQP